MCWRLRPDRCPCSTRCASASAARTQWLAWPTKRPLQVTQVLPVTEVLPVTQVLPVTEVLPVTQVLQVVQDSRQGEGADERASETRKTRLVVDMPMQVLLGKPPKMQRHDVTQRLTPPAFDIAGITLEDAALRVLGLPAVASKSFLITIGDRTVGGLCSAIRWWAPGRCRSAMSRSG